MNIIFYTTHCPKCAVLKTKLDKAGVSYSTCQDVQEMLNLGIQAAPALSINGNIFDFGQSIKWLKENF